MKICSRKSPSSKKCFKCGVKKRIDLFYVHKAMDDGHLGKCKSCTKKDVKERYYSKFEKVQAYEKARFQTPERKAKVIEYARNMRHRYPGKARGKSAFHYAVRTGKLKKLPCEKCGEKKSQGHHHDYRKPLDVTWLCFVCHRLEHGHQMVRK